MTRRILFCTIGATPQIVSETVWALKRREPPWVPDEIHVVTTSFAIGRIRQALQSHDGPLAKLFDGGFPPVTVHIPRRDGSALVLAPLRPPGDWADSDGGAAPEDSEALQDVTSEADAASMGDLILRKMAEFVGDPESEVHVSLAGGRKTMSAHALLAMTLVGRPWDQASHVLVEPSEFEDNGEFWHPDQGGLIGRTGDRHKNPRPPPSLDPRSARISLVPTPAPLMRYEVKDERALSRLALSAVVAEVNSAAALRLQPRVRLLTHTNMLVAAGQERRLAAKHFAIYRMLATARREGWPGVGPDGDGDSHVGWLSVPQICVAAVPERGPLDVILLRFIKEAVAAEGGDAEDHKAVQEWSGVVVEQRPRKRLDLAIGALGSNTRLIEALRREFGAPVGAVLAPASIDRKQRKPFKDQPIRTEGASRFGLTLPPEAIEIL